MRVAFARALGTPTVMTETAKRAFIATIVSGAVIVVALALWKLRLVLSLVFLAFILAAAMRPGIDWLARHRVPRPGGLALHYLAIAGILAAAIWLVAPRALHQVDSALGPNASSQLTHEANNAGGIKHDILIGIRDRLKNLPSKGKLVRPAAEVGLKAFEAVIGIFFVFASAAYWIFERDKAVDMVCSLLPRPRRKVVRDTWTLIDLKLGAFVRGQGLLVIAVAITLSLLFWAVGVPYWILVGSFAGLVEIVPVIGPLSAGALAIGVGLTSSVHTAVLAGLCVLGVRLLEDYLIIPRVLGEAVGLSPLLVLFSVSAVGILFGGFAVLFAIPIAAVLVTLFDVIARNLDPAEQEMPTVLFSTKDGE